jgi:hypothetical protein
MEHKGYYVPARFVSDKHLPIRYIALYEQDLDSEDGIRVYGEVLTAMKMRRRMIPVTMRMNGDPEEVYYYFTVRKWEPLPQPILIQDSRRGRPQFTNKFLLDHCTKSYQLFSISSEEEYRLMVEINKAFDHLRADIGEDNTAVYRINDKHSVIVSEGYFTITNDNGDILDRISVSSFTLSPRAGFGRIKRIIG